MYQNRVTGSLASIARPGTCNLATTVKWSIPVQYFTKEFWPLISEPFINCVNEFFEKGEMSCSQKQAVITLIEKKGKDCSFLEN